MSTTSYVTLNSRCREGLPRNAPSDDRQMASYVAGRSNRLLCPILDHGTRIVAVATVGSSSSRTAQFELEATTAVTQLGHRRSARTSVEGWIPTLTRLYFECVAPVSDVSEAHKRPRVPDDALWMHRSWMPSANCIAVTWNIICHP